ncbi:MAG: L,D-transpeptidase family protein [Bacteroidota bacterium]
MEKDKKMDSFGVHLLRIFLLHRRRQGLFLLLLMPFHFLVGCFDSKQSPSSSTAPKDRVEQAKQEKQVFLTEKLRALNVPWNEVQVFIRAFKEERLLEVWVKSKKEKKYQPLIHYGFCQLSGQLGPKRKEGDRQVPEGCYQINRFNPQSNYYLSLGLNYPNRSDRIRGDQNRPGSDIFIHGDCVTIGCIPIRDDKIKELYLLAKQAKENGQQAIAVNIYPAKLTKEKMAVLEQRFPLAYLQFWRELKVIYDQFEHTKEVPQFKISDRGEYQLLSMDSVDN